MEAMNKERLARETLWKVPQMQTFGFAAMQSKLADMAETLADVLYTWDEDEGTILESVDDDDELAREFHLLCTDVQSHLEEIRKMFTAYSDFNCPSLYDLMTKTEQAEMGDGEDWEEAQYTTCRAYDDCTVALLGKRFQYPMSGFDPYEQDFFGLDEIDKDTATQKAKKRLMRLTKEQMVDLIGKSVAILISFNDFRIAYERFMIAYEILTGTNQATMEAIGEINKLYDEATAAWVKSDRGRNQWKLNDKERFTLYRFHQTLENLPPRMWVE